MKQRSTYIVLAVLLGTLGIHNFYLGRHLRGIIQLLITVLTFGLGVFITFPWAIIEACITKFPSEDVQQTSPAELSQSAGVHQAPPVASGTGVTSPGDCEWEFNPKEIPLFKRILAFDFMPSHRLVKAHCTNGRVTIVNGKGVVMETEIGNLLTSYFENTRNGNNMRLYTIKLKDNPKQKMIILRNYFQMEEEEWVDFEQKLSIQESKFSSFMKKAESIKDELLG